MSYHLNHNNGINDCYSQPPSPKRQKLISGSSSTSTHSQSINNVNCANRGNTLGLGQVLSLACGSDKPVSITVLAGKF